MSRPRNWSLVGIADHQGVIEVGGRIGAARGPAAFRRVLSRFRGRERVQETLVDGGTLADPGADVAENHRRAAEMLAAAHRNTGLSVLVGGGHDHGYSHLVGLTRAGAKKLGCINIDAHFDVRKPDPRITSGSPFYLAIESGTLDPSRFIEFGIQSHCNAPALWDYIEAKGVRVVPFGGLRHGRAAAAFAECLRSLDAAGCDQIAISLDLDAAAAAFAPGVSAPLAEGFSGSDIIEMMELAGAHPSVTSLGIFELNPEHDLDDRTARLAATAAWHFVAQKVGPTFFQKGGDLVSGP